MHPILFTIGSFPVGTYGVLLAVAALAAVALGRLLAPRVEIDPERLTDLFVFSLLGAFVGAKVALILGDFGEFPFTGKRSTGGATAASRPASSPTAAPARKRPRLSLLALGCSVDFRMSLTVMRPRRLNSSSTTKTR